MFEETNRYLTRIVYPGGNARSFAYEDLSDSTISAANWTNYIGKANTVYENGIVTGWYQVSGDYTFYAEDGPDTSLPVAYASKAVNGVPIFTPSWQYWTSNGTDLVKVFWGYKVQVTNENGVVVNYTYAYDGQLVYVDNGDKKMQYNFMSDGNMNRVEWNTGTYAIAFVYDVLGQLLSESNQYANTTNLNHTVSYTYDAVGNRTGLIAKCNSSVAGSGYKYDEMDRLTNVASGSITCSYTNTPAGFLAKKTYNNGVWTSYAYDSIGRLVALTNAVLTNATASAILDAYQYGGRTGSGID